MSEKTKKGFINKKEQLRAYTKSDFTRAIRSDSELIKILNFSDRVRKGGMRIRNEDDFWSCYRFFLISEIKKCKTQEPVDENILQKLQNALKMVNYAICQRNLYNSRKGEKMLFTNEISKFLGRLKLAVRSLIVGYLSKQSAMFSY